MIIQTNKYFWPTNRHKYHVCVLIFSSPVRSAKSQYKKKQIKNTVQLKHWMDSPFVHIAYIPLRVSRSLILNLFCDSLWKKGIKNDLFSIYKDMKYEL